MKHSLRKAVGPKLNLRFSVNNAGRGGGGGGGALPINGLMAMCRWMGSHFHDRTDYNGVAFSSIFYRVTRMGSHFCGILRVRKICQVVIYKRKDSPKKNVTVFIAVV